MEFPINSKKLAEYLGYKPNKWQAEVEKSKARFKAICAGSRSGKTFFATNSPEDGIVRELFVPESRAWIVAPNYDLCQKIWIPLVSLVRGKLRGCVTRVNDSKGFYEIRTAVGGMLWAKSAEDPDKLVGEKLNRLVVDEAALVKEKAWKQSLRPRLIDLEGSALFISTPKGKNWFYDLWLQGQEPRLEDWESWKFSTYDNVDLATGKLILPEGELEKVKRDMPEYEYRQEILAEFSETAEQVFRNIRNNIKGKLKKERDKFEKHTLGVDLGRKGSYSIVIAINRKTKHVDYFDRFRRVSWTMIVGRIKQAIEKFQPYPIVVDATGLGDPVVEDLEKAIGKKVKGFILGEVSKKQLIDKAALWVEGGRVSYPEIPILLKEMERYGRFINPDTGRYKYRPMKKFSQDAVIAFAFAIWPLREKFFEGPAEVIKFDHPKY